MFCNFVYFVESLLLINIMEVFKDLSVSCSICQQEIPVNAKTSHQQHHKAMKILKYDKGWLADLWLWFVNLDEK